MSSLSIKSIPDELQAYGKDNKADLKEEEMDTRTRVERARVGEISRNEYEKNTRLSATHTSYLILQMAE